MNEIETADDLRDFMTEPTDGLARFIGDLNGDILVLGAGGKMGSELIETIVRADRQAGADRRVGAASRFSDGAVRRRLEELGVRIHAGDLTERDFLDRLPDAPNVFFMAGVKFGSSKDWRHAFHFNAIMPYLAGERFTDGRIVVFSSGNPYPHTRPEDGGCREDHPLEPQGVYGWGIVARESAFATTAMKSPEQKLCFYRLMYAQHLAYGVLVDLAQMVWRGEPVSLAMPAVNLISQRDAIDVAIRALGHCANPAFVLNGAGPVVYVRDVIRKLGQHMGREPELIGPEGETALLNNDDLAVELFGPYRDSADEMIEAAAKWVMRGGESWHKPTLFGKVEHQY